ncbi:hypothetical protein [Pseudoduganella chitinolytica]|uniref:Uncharacterized protein n=1 Tax=Pseudoduganella chitinolytica TaxID=34070 RepID=A0ABY8BB25_9BURK|nr:hypothetical protein [Pseudoduganella chitinolytica]WEF33120.1 hypothetical protein PX653_27650 [Pseudoduganella chitinolytica]
MSPIVLPLRNKNGTRDGSRVPPCSALFPLAGMAKRPMRRCIPAILAAMQKAVGMAIFPSVRNHSDSRQKLNMEKSEQF